MITPEYLSYSLDTLKVQRELEQSILNDIARRIVKTNIITDTADWQTEKLRQAGMLYRDIVSELSSKTKRMKSEICALYEDAGTEVFNYPETDTPIGARKPMSVAMRRIWDASLKKTSTEAVNLTKTTAITAQTLYIQSCDLAQMQVASGAFSYQTAIKNAIANAVKQGVTVFYPTGFVSKLDVAVRRSVLTGINQTAGQLQLMRADEMECDLMELSAHAGARPNHAEWQGQIVSRSGKPGYLSPDDIGYRRADGFMGVNCRHNWYLYFGGPPAHTREMLDEYKNHTVEYDGKTMTDYEASQKQRQLERSIRTQKQLLTAKNAAINETASQELKNALKGEFDRESAVLKKREEKLADFCKQTGRRADGFRTQVYGFDRSISSKAVWGNKKYVANAEKSGIIKNKGNTLQSELGEFKKKLQADGRLSKQYYNKIKNKFAHGSDVAKAVYNKYVPYSSVADNKNMGTAYYDIAAKKIHMNFDADLVNSRGTGATWFHEHGHLIDNALGKISNNDDFRALIKKDRLEYAQKYGREHGLNTFDKIDSAISKELKSMRKHSAVSDIYDGLTKGNIVGIAGHSAEYWKIDSNLTSEAFAHMFEAQFDSVRYKEMQKHFPKSLEYFENMLKGVIK